MKRNKILIVDDSKAILCLLQVVLGKRYDVYLAIDGFAAMNWLMNGNRPDVIISDLEMPQIDGVELLSYLSQSRYYEDVPIIVLSGSNKEEIVEKCKNLKISSYITKPFDPAELLQRINMVIGKKNRFAKDPFLLS